MDTEPSPPVGGSGNWPQSQTVRMVAAQNERNEDVGRESAFGGVGGRYVGRSLMVLGCRSSASIRQ